MRQGKHKGFTLLELLILIAIIVIFGLGIMCPSLKKSRIASNENAASSSLKTFHGQMAMWKKKHRTGNGRVYPPSISHNPRFRTPSNLGKYCGLHFEVNDAGNRLKMIGYAEAAADCRADGNTQARPGAMGSYTPSTNATTHSPLCPVTFTMIPRAGYWFGLCNNWGAATTQVYDWTRCRNRFAFVAFPVRYGRSGEHTFAINEEGTVYYLDRGRSGWQNYPGNDPTPQSWEITSE